MPDWLTASAAATELVEAFLRAGQAKDSYARILEEERVLRELRALAARERIPAEALSPIAARVIAIAGDADTYDGGAQLSAGLYAAELLAATGVPAQFAGLLREARQAADIKVAVRDLLGQAVSRS